MEMQNEFMMYTFKVAACRKKHPHDWRGCIALIFIPGKTQVGVIRESMTTVLSVAATFGTDHALMEIPANSHMEDMNGGFTLHITEPSGAIVEGTACTREVCFFAHKPEEIRTAYSLPAPLSNSGSVTMARNTDLHANRNMRRMQVDQNVNQQQWGYLSDSTNSDVIGLPQSRADPSMNSRYDAISKRGQDFIEHNSMPSFNPKPSSATSVAAVPSNLSGWGSHDGKLDWSIPGDELNRRTKLYSSGLGNTSSIPTMAAPNVDDPDVLLSEEPWVESLVKDDDPTLDSDE